MQATKRYVWCTVGALSLCLLFGPARTVFAQSSATVNVSGGTALNTLNSNAFGINEAVWIPVLLDPALPGMLQPLHLAPVRWPGGSTSDVYHWQTNSITTGQSGYANPSNTFDNFMSVMAQSGVSNVMITANYGSNSAGTAGGDPNEAAGWVQYANITKGYGVKYWEIGNEVYGNGEYGSAWECDLHTDHSPTAYANNALSFISAMKAVDSTIKIGVVLCTPGSWPDGTAPDWNTNVLPIVGTKADAVIIHWYAQSPRSVSDSGLLSSTSSIASAMTKLKMLLNAYCGPNVQIWLTETNSVSSSPGPQTLSIVNALFAADDYMTWLENGVTSVEWWALHNGPNTSGSSYGDYGILSTGQSPEPPAETPTPSYYGIDILQYLGRPGDTMAGASSSNSLIAAHAVKQANGNLALLLINKDPTNTYNVTVNVGGYIPAGTATIYTYGQSTSAITTSSESGVGPTFVQTVPPYSLTTIVMTPGTATAPPPTPAGLAPIGTANQLVKLGWNTSPGATSYNVLRATTSGGPYTQIGATADVSYSDTAVTNGTTYYYVVSASNAKGTSGNSSQTSAVPNPIPPPTKVTGSGGPGRVTIQWTQSTASGLLYNNVYRSSASGGPYILIKTLSPSTSVTLSAPSKVTYYYVVTAVTAVGESAYSNQVAVAAR